MEHPPGQTGSSTLSVDGSQGKRKVKETLQNASRRKSVKEKLSGRESKGGGSNSRH